MNQKNPKISVIVAIYKAEGYLRKCLDSLLKQTLHDFEVLLIDDGSPDCSGDICDKYAEEDSRIKVIHKENGGVSSARQCGVDNAKGEYVIHVDPDDWVEPDMLESLYNKAVSSNADIVICDFYINCGDIQTYQKQEPTSLEAKKIICELFQRLHGSCCNKLVKRVCYNDVRFPTEICFSEDLVVCVRLLQKVTTVVYLNKAFYHYQLGVNDNSLTQNINRRILDQDIILYELLKAECYGDSILLQYLHENIMVRLIMRAFMSGILSSEEFKKTYGKYRKYIFKNSEFPCYKRIIIYLACLGYNRKLYKFYNLWKSVK